MIEKAIQKMFNEDLYGWTVSTVSLMKEGKYHEADMDKVIEEIEALGRSSRREFSSRLGVLIAHLLKCQYQPLMKNASWIGTIERQRIEISDLLDESPSLTSYIEEVLPKAYKYALSILKEETPIDVKQIGSICPYTFESLMDDSFFPDGPEG